jgi:hypothetical protein
MEQGCGPRAVEIVPGKHCDFITHLAKRARAQSGGWAEVQLLEYGTDLWSHCNRNRSKNNVISALILPRERELSLVHV